MKNLVFLYAGDNLTHAFDKVFSGKSAFELSLQWANSVENVSGLIIAATDKNESAVKSLASGAKVLVRNQWKTCDLLEDMARELNSSGCDTVVYSSADRPFLDAKLTSEVLDCHRKYVAEYTFADGYPYGFAPEVINCGTVGILNSISHDQQKNAGEAPVSSESIFNVLKTDINSFEVEAVIAPKDYRMLRFDFSCKVKRNMEGCVRLWNKALDEKIPFDAVSLSNLAKETAAVHQTLPSFYNIQICQNMNAVPFYSPYPEEFKNKYGIFPCRQENSKVRDMSLEKFNSIVQQISDFSETAVVSLSAWGEPLLHENFFGIVEAVLKNPNLCLLIETDGILVTDEVAHKVYDISNSCGARKIDMPAVTWIVQLDAFTQSTYGKIWDGGDFGKAVQAVSFLEKYFDDVYPQFVRMNENEHELEMFFRYWKSKDSPSEGKLIIQKYDSFCKSLPDRKPADLAPLSRNVCWHIKRDVTILCDGNVPLCREEILSDENLMGNVFNEGIEEVWKKMTSAVAKHLVRDYSEKCRNCDEYYTFNF